MTQTAVVVHPDPIACSALRVKLETHYPCLTIAGEAVAIAQGEALIHQIKPDFAFVEAGLSGSADFQTLAKFNAKRIGLCLAHTRLIAFAFRADWEEVFDYLYGLSVSDSTAGTTQRTPKVSRGATLCPNVTSSDSCREWLERCILLGDAKKITAVPLKDLIRIQAQGRKSVLYVAGRHEPIVSLMGINAWAEALIEIPFLFHSHRSHLINLMHSKQHADALYSPPGLLTWALQSPSKDLRFLRDRVESECLPVLLAPTLLSVFD